MFLDLNLILGGIDMEREFPNLNVDLPEDHCIVIFYMCGCSGTYLTKITLPMFCVSHDVPAISYKVANRGYIIYVQNEEKKAERESLSDFVKNMSLDDEHDKLGPMGRYIYSQELNPKIGNICLTIYNNYVILSAKAGNKCSIEGHWAEIYKGEVIHTRKFEDGEISLIQWNGNQSMPFTSDLTNEVPTNFVLGEAFTFGFENQNVFAELMEVTKSCSLGQITHTLYEVGGAYRRNM